MREICLRVLNIARMPTSVIVSAMNMNISQNKLSVKW